MRPIKKIIPIGSNGQNILEFNHYSEAKPHLIEQTGRYCNFCEMPILNIPAVEHILPKNCIGNSAKYENLINRWENLLLICGYCNSIKGNQDINLEDYYWPHLNNTLIPFDHLSGVISVVSDTLTNNQNFKALNTLKLYGLNRRIDSSGGQDSRYEPRIRAISQALDRYKEYKSDPKKITENAIIAHAVSTGFWTVWFTIFKDYPEIKNLLIEQFKVPPDCFDDNMIPINRNPENNSDHI